jgi:hypothetical protein
MNYSVVQTPSVAELVETVELMIKRGFRPLGGIAVTSVVRDGQVHMGYLQAMTNEMRPMTAAALAAGYGDGR